MGGMHLWLIVGLTSRLVIVLVDQVLNSECVVEVLYVLNERPRFVVW